MDNIVIQPRDRLLVHRNLARVDAPTVDITGEVAKPGRYPLTTNMRVEDLVRVAGGLKRSAFADSADLTRFAAGNSSSQRLQVKLSAALSGDATKTFRFTTETFWPFARFRNGMTLVPPSR